MTTVDGVLEYYGCNFFKQRLILSILSGKPIRIKNIRPAGKGLQEFEVSLIRLVDKITNGTTIEISSNGTEIYFSPGFLEGGPVQHECNVQRGIGYYLELLVAVGPFCKNPLKAVLNGVTNSSESVSVDTIKSSTLKVLKRFLIVDEGLDIMINKRGLMPLGGGEVFFKCPVKNNFKAIQVMNFGKVKRIRGIVYSCKVPSSVMNRTVEAAKGVLLNFIPDIYIYTDQNKGKSSGKSPGYGIQLTAETNNDVFYSAEGVSQTLSDTNKNPTVPEDLGISTAHKLIEEIFRGGCVDSSCQWIVTLFMALSQKDVSKYVTGMLSEYTVAMLQHLKEFFDVTFKIDYHKDDDEMDDDEEENDENSSPKVSLTCVGIGYKNTNKRIT
ncbi:probable RNA 3'-terminal phosphate cyclase-like protein [Culicoides brevitarsis]|uniref:probable RNA 3'-terminal phosphate cyclase-like protein n=1 Tax=Culicoides brevitarsis TaxID=469753 RepID=UPI00307BC082